MHETILLAKLIALKKGLIGMFEEEKTPFEVWTGEIAATEGLADGETEYITVKVRFEHGNSGRNAVFGRFVGRSVMVVVGPPVQGR